jgi:hypothetical protein
MHELTNGIGNAYPFQGRIQDFKLRGAHLKKLRRAEGSANIFGIFRVENHDFTPNKWYFFQFGSAPAFGALVHPNICAVRVAQSLVFFVVICLIFCHFSFWSNILVLSVLLWCLPFDYPLVSSLMYVFWLPVSIFKGIEKQRIPHGRNSSYIQSKRRIKR